MIKSVLFKTKKLIFSILIILSVVANYAFGPGMGEKEWLDWSNKFLSESFNSSLESRLKKWEITVSPERFIRLRKFYPHGKQEYYSLHINKLDSINYVQTATGGELRFKTIADDVIVQTYEDPKGNIDSMSTVLVVPVKEITPERLDSLNDALKYFKENK